MKVFLTSILAQVFLTGYILYHVWYVLPAKKKYRIPVVGLILLEVLLSFFAYFFHKHLNDDLLHYSQIICGTWFIASIYFSLFLIILDIICILNYFFSFFPSWVKVYYKQIKYALSVFFIILVTFFLICGYDSYLHPKVKHQTIHISKKAGKISSVRIAFASDIHAGIVVDRSQVKRYVDLINAQKCDIIILGGDMIDYDLHILNKQDVAQEFCRLKAPLGVYAILGNHEYRFNREKKIEWLRSAGLTILQDSVVMPEMSFYLIGRDDKKNKNRKSLSYLVTGLDKSKPIIVADHQPTNIMENVMNETDFVMMGHVHNGQIWPYNHFLQWYWDGFSEGYGKKGNTQTYISSGLGLSGPPFRVFTDSEIIVFEIIFGS